MDKDGNEIIGIVAKLTATVAELTGRLASAQNEIAFLRSIVSAPNLKDGERVTSSQPPPSDK